MYYFTSISTPTPLDTLKEYNEYGWVIQVWVEGKKRIKKKKIFFFHDHTQSHI
jgi:hypothetical protein